MNKITQYFKHRVAGLGDHVRGALHLFRMCKKNQLQYKVDFSQHQINDFVSSLYLSDDSPAELNLIELYVHSDGMKFSHSIIQQLIESIDNLRVCTNIGQIVTPTNLIELEEDEKEFLNNLIILNEDLLNEAEQLKNQFNIPEKTLLQIRFQDENDSPSEDFFDQLASLNIDFDNCIIYSNHEAIKDAVIERFGGQKITTNASHFNLNMGEDSVRDNLIEYYLAGKFQKAICVSSYPWISNFIAYRCLANNVPLEGFFITQNDDGDWIIDNCSHKIKDIYIRHAID